MAGPLQAGMELALRGPPPKVPSSILDLGTAFFALSASMTTTIRRDTSVSGETPPKIQKVTLMRPFHGNL